MWSNVQIRLERGALRMATYRSARQERQSRLERYRAARDLWRARAGIPLALLPIGDAPGAELSAVLMALRLGACDQCFTTEFEGFPAEVSVSHDQIGDRLRFTARSVTPEIDPLAWPPQTASHRKHSLTGRCADRAIRLAGVTLDDLGHASDVGGYAHGHTASIVLGDGQVTSQQWSAYVLGLKLNGTRWQGSFGEVDISLRPVHPDPPWSGLAARARKIRLLERPAEAGKTPAGQL